MNNNDQLKIYPCAHCGILGAPMRKFCALCDGCYGMIASQRQTDRYNNYEDVGKNERRPIAPPENKNNMI